METEKIRALVAAADTGSLSAAASKLGYSPSGISRMISQLESQTGYPLLVRHHNGVIPSDSCQILLPALRQLLHDEDQILQMSASISGAVVGQITIGTSFPSSYWRLSEYVARFGKLHPGVTIRMKGNYSSALLRELNDHKLDFCLISKREGSHRWIPLFKDEVSALVQTGSSLASMKRIPVTMYETQPFIEIYPGADIDNNRVFEHYGITPNTTYTTYDIRANMAMVSAGLGIGMCNKTDSSETVEGVTLLPLDPPQIIEAGIACLGDLSPAGKAFLEFVLKSWEKEDGVYSQDSGSSSGKK